MSLSVVTDPSTLSVGDYIKGFTDLSGHTRLFDAAVALPQVTSVPARMVATTGPWLVNLTQNALSSDYGSPQNFVLDQRVHIIKASTSTG